MTREQFNKTIETVINSPRNNLQMISVLQNAFALYVQEETDRIVEQLEEYKKQWLDSDYLDGVDEIIEIVKAGGVGYVLKKWVNPKIVLSAKEYTQKRVAKKKNIPFFPLIVDVR